MRAPQNYVGPVSTAGLMQLKAHNYVAADTYVWASHLNGWSRLGEQSEFAGAAAAGPAAAAGGPTTPAAVAPAPAPPPAVGGGVRSAAAVAAPGGATAALPSLPSLGLARKQQGAPDGVRSSYAVARTPDAVTPNGLSTTEGRSSDMLGPPSSPRRTTTTRFIFGV